MNEMRPDLGHGHGADLLVIQPDASDPLDRFADWLAADGIVAQVVRPYAGDAVPHVLEQQGLLVLGGAMSSNDDADHPWLEDIRILCRDAVAGARPTLGICLGAQLLAQALGGAVTACSTGIEAGVVDVRLRDSAEDDALFGGLDAAFPMGAMHGDVIAALPPDALWLADSQDCPHQAYRVGTAAWGVQFHPEISPLTYRTWATLFSSPDAEDVRRVERGLVELPARDAEISTAARAVSERFAGLVHASAGQADRR